MTPLKGMTGTKKKIVMKRIPLLVRKGAVVPQLPQRIGCGVCPDPQVKKRMPIITKNIRAPLLGELDSLKIDDKALRLPQAKRGKVQPKWPSPAGGIKCARIRAKSL